MLGFLSLRKAFDKVRNLREDLAYLSDPLLHDEDVVVFLGLEAEPVGNDFQLWIGRYYAGQFQEWPASTCNEDLFDVFRDMKYGQMFRITEEGKILQPDFWANPIEEIDHDLAQYPILPITLLERRKFELSV